MVRQYFAHNLRPLNLQELSATVTTYIGTLLCTHDEENNILHWVRSGLFLAQQDLLAHPNGKYKQSRFGKMILEMKLPTLEDVKKVQDLENQWQDWDQPHELSMRAFLEKAGKLFAPMERSLKMYPRDGSELQNNQCSTSDEYIDGSDNPFLMRMEALENVLKLPGDDIDPANMAFRLRVKHIVRRFLLHRVWFTRTGVEPAKARAYFKVKQVCHQLAVEQYFKTAFASSGHLMRG